jgi:hypothetical protein
MQMHLYILYLCSTPYTSFSAVVRCSESQIGVMAPAPTRLSHHFFKLCLVGEKFLKKLLHQMFRVMLEGVFRY